jgi:hypothetical protein
MRHIRTAIGATTVNPELLTAAESLQYEGYQRREEINAAILTLAKDKVPIKEIVRRLGHSRQLVRRVIRGRAAGYLSNPAEFAGTAPALARCTVVIGMPEQRRPVAAPQGTGVPRLAPGGDRMGDPAATSRES